MNLTSTVGSITNRQGGAGAASSSFKVLTRAEVAPILGGVVADETFRTPYFHAAGHVLGLSIGSFSTVVVAASDSVTVPPGGTVNVASGPTGAVITAAMNFNVSDLSVTCCNVVICAQTSVIELRIDPTDAVTLILVGQTWGFVGNLFMR